METESSTLSIDHLGLRQKLGGRLLLLCARQERIVDSIVLLKGVRRGVRGHGVEEVVFVVLKRVK